VVMDDDSRPLQGKSSLGGGWLIFIPLWPYGTQRISPDGATPGRGFPGEVTETVVRDLQSAKIATKVEAREFRPDETLPRGAYSLHLTLLEGIYNRHSTAYGLSFAGVYLWLLGLPVSYGSVELGVMAEVRDSRGRSVGASQFYAETGVTEFFYYNMSRAYSKAMVEAYEEISPDLVTMVAGMVGR